MRPQEFLNPKHGIGQATELPLHCFPFVSATIQEKKREQVMPQFTAFPSHWADVLKGRC